MIMLKQSLVLSVGLSARLLFILVVALATVAGCQRADNHKQVIYPGETSVAPVANFNQSLTSGNAPLSVAFTSTATAGSSAITSWQWEFGDGASSSEEHPGHTYTQPGVYSVSLTVTSAVGSNRVSKADLIDVLPADSEILLSVVNRHGALLTGVEATSADFTLLAQEDSSDGLIVTLTPQAEDGVIRLHKDGFLDAIIHLSNSEFSQSKSVTMLARSQAIAVDADAGGIYFGDDGISVEVSPGSLVNGAGELVTGMVELYMTPVNMADPITQQAFPGTFNGRSENSDNIDQLFSYGVAEISFEQQGEPLQLATGMVANLRLPLYFEQTLSGEPLSAGATMPLWYLDEQSGDWMWLTSAIVDTDVGAPNGLVLVAQTPHFTYFNADINAPTQIGQEPLEGGGTVGEGARFCNLHVELLHADMGALYHYNLRYVVNHRPSSLSEHQLIFDGSEVEHPIVFGYDALISVVGEHGEQGNVKTRCENDLDVHAQIDLSAALPGFRFTDLRSQPEFRLNSNNQFEIFRNTLFLGAYFVGAKRMTVSGGLLSQPTSMASGVYLLLDYTPDMAPTLDFDAVLTSSNGTSEETLHAVYIDAQAPGIGSAFGFRNFDSVPTLLIDFAVGADSVEVFYQSSISAVPELRLGEFDLRSGSLERSFEEAGSGHFRLVYHNQYGDTQQVIRISETIDRRQ